MYSFDTDSYERLTDFGEWPAWLPDSRRLMFVSEGSHFSTVDAETRDIEKVFSVMRNVIGPPRLPADGSQVFYSRRVTEADVWLLSFEEE